jgi:hypothetical protein
MHTIANVKPTQINDRSKPNKIEILEVKLLRISIIPIPSSPLAK